MSARASIVCVLLVACSSSTGPRPPTATPISHAPSPWRGAPICRAQLAPEDVTRFEAHARDGQSTCEERARLAAHYFDLQLETYDHWQPQLDEHLVWLANQCPDSNQTCLLSMMVPSIALTSAWKAQAEAHPRDATVHDNADAVAWQAKRDAEMRDEPHRVDQLAERARDAFETGNVRSAEAYAIEALLHIPLTPRSWNTGNLIHDAHTTLGRIALRAGDPAAARRHLLASGRTPGSPQLNSFGPTWDLAREMLAAGERDAVIEWLELCKAFWEMQGSTLDEFQVDIRNGETPLLLRRDR